MVSTGGAATAEQQQPTLGRGMVLPTLAICLGFFMVIMDATIVSVTVPVLRTDMAADVTALEWVTDGYTVVFAGLLLSAGTLGDRWGARRVFLISLTIFTASSAACGSAAGLAVLDAARVAQGAGAALVLPASLSLLRNAFPDQRRRAKAIGLWGGAGGAAAAIGPIAGGLLAGGLGWRWVFFVNVPVGIAVLILTSRFVRPVPPDRGRRVDLAGQVCAALAVAAAADAVIAVGRDGWTAPSVLLPAVLAVAAGVVCAIVEWRHPQPMLPPELVRRGDFRGPLLIGFALNFGFYGALFLLPLAFQERGFGVLPTGLAVLPMAAMAVAASPLSGRRMARYAPRRIARHGLLLGGAGLGGLALAGAATPYGWYVLPLVATGFGTAHTMPAATAVIVDAVPPGHAALAAGALNAARQTGGAIGVAVFGSAVATGFGSGFRVALLLGAIAFLAAALATRSRTAVGPEDASGDG